MAGSHRSATLVEMEPHLEPGDRFEVERAGPDQLRVLADLGSADLSVHTVQDAQGRTLPASFDPENRLLTVENFERSAAGSLCGLVAGISGAGPLPARD